ncbi:LOW QUALITY PROTEIN: pentatricopeptide repeat-containing protein At4g20090-like [Phalaenopsis equestris]|uniref:LOW QUALITY PROTEIN: pentatricopeptide repeat-containing protein At4g20090-like n=1 Tax=Phalaenopsis equestris TaxID=78828 RepID=UPI0009E2F852|nr:LOW QUALITY PROTEIN: pentatricopeptide repeat-containing protein At4g20090-like [Phalaenopsis equestris]
MPPPHNSTFSIHRCFRNSNFQNLPPKSFPTTAGDRSEDDTQSSTPLADDLFRSPRRSGGYTQGDASYLSLVRFYSDPPNIPALRALLNRMRSDRRPFPERLFPPIIRAFGRAGLPFEALHLFDEMLPSFQCTPSTFSLNSVLSSVVSSPDSSSLAFPFFRRAIRVHHSLNPNLLTFNLILKSLCSPPSPSLPLALHLFRSIPPRGLRPDAYTYTTLIAALSRTSRLDDAFALLDEMQLDGVAPASATFNSLLHAILRTGDLRRAANLARYMLLKGCPPTLATYNTLVHGLCRHARLEEALALIDRMVLRDGLVPNEVTYGALVDGLVKLGRIVDARRVFDVMRERGVRANEAVRSDGTEEAMNLWAVMISDGVKPNEVLYTALVDGLARHQKVAEAEDVIAKMTAGGCNPNVRTFSALMWGHFRSGNSHQALATWTKMVRCGCEPNQVSYSILINGLCGEGKVKEGMMVWKNMVSRGCTPDVMAYTAMIRGLCIAGNVDAGLRLFYDMMARGDAEPDAVAYNALFDGLIKADRLIQAFDLLSSMLERDCDPDEVTCNIFLKGLRWGEEEKGRELMEGMIVRMVRRGRINGAAYIVLLMCKKYMFPRSEIWEKMVSSFCNMKKVRVVIDKIFGIISCRNDL